VSALWQYTDATQLVVVHSDGLRSCLVATPEIQAWMALGNVPDPPPPPSPADMQNVADIAAAKAYSKLTALAAMSPAQVQAWVVANVTTLPTAQDAIATLAIAVAILARRL
jgi:hypothetical protein